VEDLRRSTAQVLRSARDARGNSSPRRRSAARPSTWRRDARQRASARRPCDGPTRASRRRTSRPRAEASCWSCRAWISSRWLQARRPGRYWRSTRSVSTWTGVDGTMGHLRRTVAAAGSAAFFALG
jgi:hypothetical protein